MRLFLSVLFALVAQPVCAEQLGEEDQLRRLPRIQVTTLPPHMGTVYANAFTLRPQDFERPGFSQIEIGFSPVELNEDQSVSSVMSGDERYAIKTSIPSRIGGLPFTDSVRDFYTQDIALPSGAYVISEIVFRSSNHTSTNDVSFCLSEGTLLFEIIGRDTLFLGRLNISYPSSADTRRENYAPLEQMGSQLNGIRGWRWTTTDLLNFNVRTISFDPELFCSGENHRVSAWANDLGSETHSPSP